MERARLREIVEKLNQEEGRKSYRKYELAEDVPEERIQSAIETYAQGARPEDVVALLDTTLRKNGRDGFLITESRIYGKCLDNAPIDLDKVRFAALTRADVPKAVVVLQDGTVREPKNFTELKRELSFFVELTGHELVDSRPDSGGFYQRYGASLRRRIKEIIERHSERNSSYRLAESEEPGLLENLIIKSGADLDPEKIVAVHNADEEMAAGRNGAFFTEHAYYECYYSHKNVEPISYMGLQAIVPSARNAYSSLLIYRNGYVQEWCHMGWEETTEDQELLREITAILQEMEEHPPLEEEEGLFSIKGWKEFADRRNEGALETYKNSVFVSSTFKDMHFERDAIHEKVLPMLNKAGLEYGQTISFCDLRWGVNTGELDDEQGSRKVLSVCLDEIERCRPYMIVILGERYGWIPEKRIIENALEGRPGFHIDELEKSVTALEIEFGALAHTGQMERTFFYFRQMRGEPSEIYKSEDAHHAQKLAELKERIRRLAGKQVKTYTVSWDEERQCPEGFNAFAQMVAQDMKAVLEGEWRRQAGRTSFQRELDMHWELAEKKALQCAARDRQILDYLRLLEQGEQMIVITGESGSGKSTLMGCLAVVLRLGGAHVLPIFAGYTAGSDTALEVVQTIVHFLGQALGETEAQEVAEEESEPLSEKGWLDRMELLAERYASKGKRQAIILVDAVDQLMADELRDKLRFIPAALSDKLKVVLSCLEDQPLPYVPNIQRLPLVQDRDRPEVIQGILRLHRRELEKPVIAVIAAKPSAGHPLYISLLVQRLLMMNKNDFDDIAGRGDGMSAITSHQLELVEKSADDLPGICSEILQAAAERIGGGFVEKAMECLAVSRHGLRERDLEGILKAEGILWNALDFSLFINYLRSMFLIRDDGRIDFSHKSFRDGIRRNIKEEKRVHEKIWTWLDTLLEHDEVQELVYHMLQADSKAAFLAEVAGRKGEEKFLKSAAKELAAYSQRDGGAWVAESLETMPEDSETIQRYLDFLLTCLDKEMGSSGEDGRTKERIYFAALPIEEKLVMACPEPENRRSLSIMHSRLGYIYLNREEEEEYRKALPHFQETLRISQELEREGATPRAKQDLSIDYRMLGKIYLKIGGEQNHRLVVQCYEESIRIGEEVVAECPGTENQKSLGHSYEGMEKLLRRDGEKEKALAYCLKCIAVREAVVKEDSGIVSRRALCYAYDDAAYIYRTYHDQDNLRNALELFGKEAVLWEGIVREERSLSNLTWLCYAYADMGDMYHELDEETDREKMLERYEKAIPLLEELQESGRDVREKLVASYKYASVCANNLGGASRLAKSREWGRRALALYEQRAREEDSVETYQQWAEMLFGYYKYVSIKEGGRNYLEQLLKVEELLYERTGEKEYKKNIKQVKLLLKMEKLAGKL